MQHLELATIADYVRGCVESGKRETVVNHLSGCAKCQAAADLFAKVVVAGLDESLCTPSPSDVHCAKALFSLHRLPSVEFPSGRAARLVFDSFAQPQLAGVRGPARASRQTVFSDDTVSVDLHQRVQENSLLTRLTGQILSKDGGAVAGMRVSLVTDTDVIAEQTTNMFGEFDMLYAPKPYMRLVVAS